MLWSSKDILNIGLTVSILVLTFFVAWILYYIVATMRDVRRIMHEVTGAIDKLNSVLDIAKEKIVGVAAVFPLVIKGIEKIVDVVGRRRESTSRNADSKEQNKNKKTYADD